MLGALMQTRALPKITQETFKDQVFFFLFPLPAPQLKFKIYFLRRAHTFLERRSFDGEEEERKGVLWRFVGNDRFRTIGDLNSFVSLTMTTNETQAPSESTAQMFL